MGGDPCDYDAHQNQDYQDGQDKSPAELPGAGRTPGAGRHGVKKMAPITVVAYLLTCRIAHDASDSGSAIPADDGFHNVFSFSC
jgi:hypothetical protein